MDLSATKGGFHIRVTWRVFIKADSWVPPLEILCPVGPRTCVSITWAVKKALEGILRGPQVWGQSCEWVITANQVVHSDQKNSHFCLKI